MEININISAFAYQNLIDLYHKTHLTLDKQIEFAIDYYIHHPQDVFEEIEKLAEERIDCITKSKKERTAFLH